MNKLEWGEELLGKEILPTNWIGGVVLLDDGRWDILIDYDLDIDEEHAVANHYYYMRNNEDYCGDCSPVFPPNDWNKKTNVELWKEIIGDGWLELGNNIYYQKYGYDWTSRDIVVVSDGYWKMEDVPAITKSLYNIRVLSWRLRELG